MTDVEELSYEFVNVEAEAIVDEFDNEPDDTRKELIDDCVGALKTAGVWSKTDVLYVLAAHHEQAGRINWKNPGTLTASLVNAPSFVADQGFTGNGRSSYLNTGYNPTAFAGQLTLNSAHIGVWSNTDAATDAVDFGARAATNTASLFMSPNSSVRPDLALALIRAPSMYPAPTRACPIISSLCELQATLSRFKKVRQSDLPLRMPARRCRTSRSISER